MAETLFTIPLLTQIIFPFLLMFVLIFAILERIKVLGEGKRQINAIISLVIALLFVSFSKAVGIVINLMPFLGVMVVIILVFMILFGFIWAEKDEFKVPQKVKIIGGLIVFIALAVTFLIITGYWDKILDIFVKGDTISSTVIMIIVVIAAVAVVLSAKKT